MKNLDYDGCKFSSLYILSHTSNAAHTGVFGVASRVARSGDLLPNWQLFETRGNRNFSGATGLPWALVILYISGPFRHFTLHKKGLRLFSAFQPSWQIEHTEQNELLEDYSNLAKSRVAPNEWINQTPHRTALLVVLFYIRHLMSYQ